MKESDYIEKSQNEQENVRNIAEITQEQLPPCLKNQYLPFITILCKTKSNGRRWDNFKYTPTNYLSKWNFPRFPGKLEYAEKISLYYIYVFQKNGFLFKGCTCHYLM